MCNLKQQVATGLMSIDEEEFAFDKLKWSIKTLKNKMQIHGLIDKGWNFGLNNNYTSAGITRWDNNTKGNIIELSRIYINSKSVNIDSVLNTILHEIAHALVGFEEGHNDIWRNKAIEIGSDGKRCRDGFLDVSENKYLLKCSDGCVFGRQRKSKNMHKMLCTKHKSKLVVYKNN